MYGGTVRSCSDAWVWPINSTYLHGFYRLDHLLFHHLSSVLFTKFLGNFYLMDGSNQIHVGVEHVLHVPLSFVS